jgi:hypothetical protein
VRDDGTGAIAIACGQDLKAQGVCEPVAGGDGVFYIEVNAIDFHGLSHWERACGVNFAVFSRFTGHSQER